MNDQNNLETLVDNSIKAKASRAAFGEFLQEFGSLNPKIVVLDADLSKSTQTQHFAKKFPDRFFNMGIAEANMIGVAAGLARAGYVPFAASFGCFLTGRFDQIRMSVSFTDTNVKLIGTHAGVLIGEDGHSQMALEDIALMRVLPNMTVLQPADEIDTKQLLEWSLSHNGPCYFRLTRQNLKRINWPETKSKAAMGQWDFLSSGASGGVVIINSGGLLSNAIEVAKQLSSEGIPASIVNASWLKPVSKNNFDKIRALDAKLVVSLEDHYTTGGLGSILAENFCEYQINVPLLKIGVNDFGSSGKPDENMKAYHLDVPGIYKQIKARMNK